MKKSINSAVMFFLAVMSILVVPQVANAATVIKPDEFWDRLQFSGTVRATFEGDYSGPPGDTFKAYYFSVQVAFSDSCAKHLSKDAHRRGYTRKTSFMDGTPNVEEYYYFIDPPFIKKFDEYAPKAFRDVEKKAGILNPNNPIEQIKRFIKATGCKSAAVYQLRQNFLRAANSQKSLQQDGVSILGAEKESVVKAETSMYGSCMARPSSEKRYCLCFEKQAKSVMTAAEYEHFMADFSRYFAEVQRPIEIESPSPPASDRRWRLYDIKRKCAR